MNFTVLACTSRFTHSDDNWHKEKIYLIP